MNVAHPKSTLDVNISTIRMIFAYFVRNDGNRKGVLVSMDDGSSSTEKFEFVLIVQTHNKASTTMHVMHSAKQGPRELVGPERQSPDLMIIASPNEKPNAEMIRVYPFHLGLTIETDVKPEQMTKRTEKA